MASTNITTQIAGPAQSWNRRTVSMPRRMTNSCSTQSTANAAQPSMSRPRKFDPSVVGEAGPGRDREHDHRLRREPGLDAVPGDGDRRPDQRREIGAEDSERDACDHREGHPGGLAANPVRFIRKNTTVMPSINAMNTCQPTSPVKNRPAANV